jgi:hypothetical protein
VKNSPSFQSFTAIEISRIFMAEFIGLNHEDVLVLALVIIGIESSEAVA